MKQARCRLSREEIMVLLEQHHGYDEIGVMAGLAPESIRSHCNRIGLSLRRAGGLVMREVCNILAVDHRTFCRWAGAGYLHVHHITRPTGRTVYRVVEWEDLIAFVEREHSWHLWDPGKIRDSALREYALEVRHGLRFLGTSEVARLLHMTAEAVCKALEQGRLRGVQAGAGRPGSPWLIRSDWVWPPELRAKSRGRQLTPGDHEYIRQQLGREPIAAIARELGVSPTAVYKVRIKLGLPAVGRGYWKKIRAKERG